MRPEGAAAAARVAVLQEFALLFVARHELALAQAFVDVHVTYFGPVTQESPSGDWNVAPPAPAPVVTFAVPSPPLV